MFSWQSIQARSGKDRACMLTGQSVDIILDALSYASDIWRWKPADANQADAIEAAVSQAINEVMTSAMLGQVVYTIAATLPDHLLPCDGSQYNRVDYPALYAVLHSQFIIDADTFVTPDLIDRVVVGAGNLYAVNSVGGAATVSLTANQNGPHSHTYTPPTLNIDLEAAGVPDIFAAGVGLPTQTGSSGTGEAHENMPPYRGLIPCLVAM